MSMEALPEVALEPVLEGKFLSAKSSADKDRWAEELLLCYSYTNPEKATALLQTLHTTSDKSLQVIVWRTKGVLANQLSKYAEANYAFKEAYHLAESSTIPELQTDILLDWSALDMNKGNLNDAENHIEQARQLYRLRPRTSQYFHLLIRQAYLALYQNQLPQSLSDFMQAERLMSALREKWSWNDIDYISLLYSGLGELYHAAGERVLAREAFQNVIRICRHYGLVARLAWHHLNLGNANLALDKWDEAIDSYNQAHQVNYPGQEKAKAGAWANLGFIFLQQQKAREANHALNQAENFYQKEPIDSPNLAVIYNWKARLAQMEGNKQAIMAHFIRASEYARAVQDNQQLSLICRDIAQYFAEQEDYQNAYDYQLLHDELGEKAREENQQRRLMEIQVKYETEQVEQEAAELRAQTIELRLQAMRAQMNPHFLFNALNGIQNFIHSEDPDKASRYLAKFAGLVRKSLNLSNTELITLEDEVAFIQDYLFINQKLRFEDRLEFTVHVDEDLDEDRLVIPPMMIQPFVENAIEHGFIKRKKGKVEISIYPVGEELVCCTVKDDGIGREAAIAFRADEPQRENHQSLGIGITKERLELLNRSGFPGHRLEVVDLYDNQHIPCGTKVELYFPVRRKTVQ
ncbi:MAG: histidine kinase [Saprospiraceae bacterium]|nr:histidine kinase [Saprospiraceae bacterium]